MTVGIAAIFKNESPYIIEWIAFHRAVNVSRFFIADNESTDGSKQLLRALDAAGIINYVDFPFVGNTTQLAAYSLLQKDYGRNVEGLAFIDAPGKLQDHYGTDKLLWKARRCGLPELGDLWLQRA